MKGFCAGARSDMVGAAVLFDREKNMDSSANLDFGFSNIVISQVALSQPSLNSSPTKSTKPPQIMTRESSRNDRDHWDGVSSPKFLSRENSRNSRECDRPDSTDSRSTGTFIISPRAFSTPRKFLKRLSSFGKSFTAETEETKTDDLESSKRKLEYVLSDPETRQELVQNILGSHKQGVLEIRFVVAVNEYHRTVEKRERRRKGLKILDVFFSENSPFKIDNEDIAPTHLRQELQLSWRVSETLSTLREITITHLLNNTVVLEYLKEFQDREVSREE